ncbi:MAG: PIG-L family deacetylase [Acidimicrobiaceae bacterium]|nr:PIG-L family deacetylase [Acidimicrobiaceae bacterium]
MTVRSVLAVGGHPDDVELGCGATLLAHHAMGQRTSVLVMTAGEQSHTGAPRRAEQEAAAGTLGAELYWGGFTDCEIPADRRAIDRIEEVIAAVGPDVVYVHAPDDAHQDHRTVSAAAVSAARRQCRILFYATPSTLRFEPTVFVDVERYLEGKLAALACHESQVNQESVWLDAVAASARHWGAVARIHFAEAFAPVRFVWDVEASRSADLAGDFAARAMEFARREPSRLSAE